MDFRKLAQAEQLFASRLKQGSKEDSRDMFRLIADRLEKFAKRDPSGAVTLDVPESEVKGPEMWALARYQELNPSQQHKVHNRMRIMNRDVSLASTDLTDNLGEGGIDPGFQ